ncbi:MAG: cobalt-precorrin-4/precorrin-4 C(11)-methyltransferase [Halococcoides sp.]
MTSDADGGTDAETGAGDAIPFVGAGPGDPRLITVAGRDALAAADLVVHAGSLVNPAVVDTHAPDADRFDSAGRDLDEIVDRMVEAHRAGRAVVRLHSGDPGIYGATVEQRAALADRGIDTYVVPGVTAASAASAALDAPLTLPGVANHVAITRPAGRTLDRDDEHVSTFVGLGDVTTCLYLGTGAIADVADRLLADGVDPATPVAIVYHASWPDERVIETTIDRMADRVADADFDRSALVVIRATTAESAERSVLYDDWPDP